MKKPTRKGARKPKTVDSLLHARWVVPVDNDNTVLEQHSVAIADGKIKAILPTAAARQKYCAEDTRELGEHVLIPGLINAHAHSAMTLLRGIADDLPLMEWLEQHIWPAEAQCVNEQFVADGTRLAIAEMLKSGTTTFADMYFFPNIVAREARSAGMRACVGLIAIDFPTVWAKDAAEYISKGVALHDTYKHDALISTMFAPHAPYTVSNDSLQKITSLAAELEIPIQMHIHETAGEVAAAEAQHGERPLARLQALGMLYPELMAVHMTQLTDDEIRQLKHSKVHVIHCPASNMKLASGICPTTRLLEAGVNVALGTDSAASNNDLSMLGEMRSAALLAKVSTGEATALSAHTVLRMATLNGAKALGIDALTGSLKRGKAADITAIDLNRINTQPVHCPVAQIVYAASREQVSDVWVNGQALLREHQLTGFNEQHLLQTAAQWQGRIAASQTDKPTS
ncbi:MAG: N-ethylammeline chlorohydrolase [Gammaproteobacteria bacterium]|nr:MAG: N-ethylammeline chlorohydrolase [Gammaproteobacteria bacterium]